MTHFWSNYLKNIFSGLISLCIIFFSFKYAKADKIWLKTSLINSPVRNGLDFRVCSRVPPDRYSVNRYTKDSVSYTPLNLMRLGC